jgi:serine O-acetyltransferase
MFFLLRKYSRLPLLGSFFRLLYRLYNIAYGASIPLSVHIDISNHFPHGIHGVFISKNAVIGNENTIYQQVTIGANQATEHPKYGSPTIADNCLIGAGAKVIGNINVAQNVFIGANAVVTNDLEADITVVVLTKKIKRASGK